MTESPPIRYVTTSDGARISYVHVAGESPPFLFAYTPMSPPISLKANAPGYFPYIREFARERAWVTFDWRGTGLSSPIEGTLTVDDLVADLDAITEMIGEPVDAWTPSRGCMVVCLHAAARPQRYRSIWLRSPTLKQAEDRWFGSTSGWWQRDYRDHLRMITLQSAPLAVAERWAAEVEKGVPKESFAAYIAATDLVDLTEILPKIDVPVWVTAGVEYQHRAAARVAGLLPSATLSIWDRPEIKIELGDWTRQDWDQNLGARVAATSASTIQPPVNGAGPLSPRELEVLHLVAAGKSNPQIAETLVLSNATVATHVRHILEKTGSANRVEAANWAIEHGVG